MAQPLFTNAQNAAAVKLLVQHGADVNARNEAGMTPLLVWATEGEDTGAVETMKALLRAGADPNLRDSQGSTPLEYAQRRSEPNKIRLLKANGAK